MKKNLSVINILAGSLKTSLQKQRIDTEELQEIRIRIEKPIFLRINDIEYSIDHIVTKEELEETLEYISNYSLYAYEDELRQGFLTIEGGHRVGLSGKVIIEGNKIKNFQYISSINLRICHEIKGCADQILPFIISEHQVLHTLILSPPGQGKTTLLRDLVRQISDGNDLLTGQTVSVVDERSEIGGCYQGIPQNDIGRRTDILDNCPKAEGMLMMIRSMSPQILAVDEIGTKQDVDAISYAMRSGVTVLATVHAASLAELKEKTGLKELYETQCFKRYIVLGKYKKTGIVEHIYNEWGQEICIKN